MNRLSRFFVVFSLAFILIFSFVSCGEEPVYARFISDGNEYALVTADSVSDFKLPKEPEKEGYTFSGWYLGEGEGSLLFTFDSLISGETVTVYARWTEIHVHTESERRIYKAPTCTADGIAYTECLDCGYKMSTAFIERVPHNVSDWLTDTAATCTESGLRHKVCLLCGAVTEIGAISPIPHSAADSVATAPTCNAEGLLVTKCTVCDTVLSERTLAKLGHNGRTLPRVEPTETRDGLTEGEECLVCGEVLTPQQPIPAAVTGCALVIEGFDRNGTAFSTTVGSSSAELSLNGAIKINDAASLSVSRQGDGSGVIEGLSLPLSYGNNTFCFSVTSGDECLVYAVSVYRKRIVTVTFETRGSAVPPIALEEGECVESIPVSILSGYDFGGWDTDLSLPVTESITASALFTPRSDTPYTVVYYALRGTHYAETYRQSLMGTTDSPVTIPSYELAHYSVNNERSDPPSPITGDGALVISVYLDPVKYTVRFETGTAEQMPNESATALAPYLPPTPPERSGYRFDGWRYNGSAFSGIDSVTSDIYLVASWVRRVTVTFDTRGVEGLTIPSVTVDAGSPLTASVEFPQSDEKKVGLFHNGTPWIFGRTIVTDDITVVADWVDKYVTVTFETKGATPPDPITVEYESVITSIPTPVRGSTYSFEGWYVKDSDIRWIPGVSVVTSDLTLVAKWSIMTPPDVWG